jgi:hypothetical protein
MLKFAQHLHRNVGRGKADGTITGIGPGSRCGDAVSHAYMGGLLLCDAAPISTCAPLGAFVQRNRASAIDKEGFDTQMIVIAIGA